MTDKENFAKDINVPSKEQIMIDGVDVSECESYQIEANKLYPKAHYCGSIKNTFCEDNPNCYFKQLARKTLEEIELEKRVKELEQANIHIDNNRKCKAKKLEEIEQLVVACMSGYTDEFVQNIIEIIHKPEAVCFENKYRQALDDIEEVCLKDVYIFADGT